MRLLRLDDLPEVLPAITLTQPWATLWALGIKVLETRDWPTRLLGQTFAIHAAKVIPTWVLTLDFGPYSIEKDNPRGTPPAYLLRGPGVWPYRLPLGSVLGTCVVADVVPTSRCWAPDSLAPEVPGRLLTPREWADAPPANDEAALLDVSDQVTFGDFGHDRYAWVLSDSRRLSEPIGAVGGQKIWRWRPAA